MKQRITKPDGSPVTKRDVGARFSGPGNCGECLMEHVEIVPLRADGTCECCENSHVPNARP